MNVAAAIEGSCRQPPSNTIFADVVSPPPRRSPSPRPSNARRPLSRRCPSPTPTNAITHHHRYANARCHSPPPPPPRFDCCVCTSPVPVSSSYLCSCRQGRSSKRREGQGNGLTANRSDYYELLRRKKGKLFWQIKLFSDHPLELVFTIFYPLLHSLFINIIYKTDKAKTSH